MQVAPKRHRPEPPLVDAPAAGGDRHAARRGDLHRGLSAAQDAVVEDDVAGVGLGRHGAEHVGLHVERRAARNVRAARVGRRRRQRDEARVAQLHARRAPRVRERLRHREAPVEAGVGQVAAAEAVGGAAGRDRARVDDVRAVHAQHEVGGVCEVEVGLLLCIALLVLLWRCLAHILRLLLRQLATHEDRGYAVVHLVYHIVPELHTLKLEDEERVFLLVA